MINESKLGWLKLSLVPGLGPAKISRLLAAFQTPENLFKASLDQLTSTGLQTDIAQAVLHPDQDKLDNTLDWLNASDHNQLLTPDCADYPQLLKEIKNPPVVLYVTGNTKLLNQKQLAVVGSRNPTPQGRENAYEFSDYLSRTGLIITSGLALGIDGASHQGALSAGNPTIAVVGNGLDRVYPAQHRELAHNIANEGAIVSEYPPGTRPLPGHFPQRNRIISGMSLGTLVVEAAIKSGSLITAYNALEQSREVFAIPGSIHNPLSRGCHQLLREGAKLVEQASDIFEELRPLTGLNPSKTPQIPNADGTDPALDDSHQMMLDAMGHDPVSLEILVDRTGMTAAEISSVLLILELKGFITRQSGGYYIQMPQA